MERQATLNLDKENSHATKLAGGLARFTSEVTQESAALGFAAIDCGDYNPTGGVLKVSSAEAFEAVSAALKEPFLRRDLKEACRLLEQNLDGEPYALAVIFRDEQEGILKRIIETEWADADAAFDSLYPHLVSTMRTLARVGGSLMIPRAFSAAAEFVLNTRLRRALGSDQLDFEAIRSLIGDAEGTNVALDVPTLEYTLRTRLERIAESLRADPANVQLLQQLDSAVGMARSLPLEVNLAKIQNICYELLQNTYNGFQLKGEEGGKNASAWIDHFRALAEKLSVRVAEDHSSLEPDQSGANEQQVQG